MPAGRSKTALSIKLNRGKKEAKLHCKRLREVVRHSEGALFKEERGRKVLARPFIRGISLRWSGGRKFALMDWSLLRGGEKKTRRGGIHHS